VGVIGILVGVKAIQMWDRYREHRDNTAWLVKEVYALKKQEELEAKEEATFEELLGKRKRKAKWEDEE
jgi:xanthosine utilization system XapX-like protein